MRIFIVLVGIIALMIIPAVAWADGGDNRLRQFSIGAHAGLSLARFAGPRANAEFVSSFYGVGGSLGAALAFRLTDPVAAQTEVTFTLKRSHSTLDGVYAATYRMKYLEVPLLARVSLPLSRRIECYGTIGPVISILLDADAYFVDTGHVDFERGFKGIDIGLALGAGAVVPVGAMHAVAFDIRYNHGLRDIDDTVVDKELMKRAIYFTVGYRANLDDLLHGFRRKAPPPARKLPPASHAPEPDAAPTDTPAPDTEPAPTEPMSPLDKPHAHPPDHL